MENRVKCLLYGALVFSSLAFLFFVIGFSTPHWLESDDRYITVSHFVRLGLWEACFNQWTYYKDYTGKSYNGCWWIFSYEYRPIWYWLNPPWFLGVQVVMTLTMIAEGVSLLLLILFVIGCCPGKNSYFALFFLAGLTIISGLLTACCTIIFGTKSVIDRQWLENPDQNYLSWSFGMIVLSGFCILFSGMCVLVAAMQVRIESRYREPEPYEGYHMKPASTHY